ncbi:DUF6586 family protein [Alcanivorax sp. DP30]|uniref:DUF6586 family protein n=1 Tax=Alcanivorax sp. DP30 TaxID=2606217 RepID=UPI00136FE29B|nr:DUF6586 family protein [Alcanivorax sp. DP30]MZR62153.1 hypothetical protein [Alcanivorax sp. DP30]
MSRMVRENTVSGLRERIYFANAMLRQLTHDQRDATPTLRLALRGAVVFHLYSALVGMIRQSAKTYQVAGADSLFSLSALEQAFVEAGVEAPEVAVLSQARKERGDLVAWLDSEMQTALGASGLARRPAPPSEANALNLMAEDRYAPLAEGDLERLSQAASRVGELIEHCVGYLEEW